MGLTFKTETYKEVTYYDLDKFINEEFPQLQGQFESAAYEEWNNDSNYIMRIDGEADEYYDEKVEEMLKTGKIPSFITAAILNYLCRQGKIEKGEYLIQVSW